MSPEVAARAYEPFFTTGKVGKGTGLGLAAVYSFAQQSGGWTTIDSREGAGTTVSIFLQPAIAGHSTAVPLEHTDDQRLRALVVDDEESLAELVAGWLGELGLETRVATDSAMAVSLAREFEPHLLLSDSNLGEETDGAALAQKLTESLPTLVTVFMTGFSDRLRALETVGVMTLAKPFSRDDLQMALVKVLGPRFATSTEPTGTQS
jgi:CheY-like chemotaxis protein